MLISHIPSLGLLRKRPFIPMGFLIVILVLVMLPSTPPSGSSSARMNTINAIKNVFHLPTFLKDVSPDPKGSNIYQIVTSDPRTLLPRHYCSVESYCRHNPGSVVWFLLVETPSLQGEAILWLNILRNTYSNFRVANLDIKLTVEQTPVKSIITSGKLMTSLFPLNHMSDVLRMAVVTKFGGLYTDFDFICLRSVAGIRNTMALALVNRPMNGFFHFDAGHPLLQLMMENGEQTFRGDDWGFNGPYLFSRTSKKNCPDFDFLTEELTLEDDPMASSFVSSMINAFDWGGGVEAGQNNKTLRHSVPYIMESTEGPCQNVTLILDTLALMPVNITNIEQLFQRDSVGLLDEAFNRSFCVHLFNKYTSNIMMQWGEATAAEDLFSNNCPLVYNAAALNNIWL